jgi:hypothetical protein
MNNQQIIIEENQEDILKQAKCTDLCSAMKCNNCKNWNGYSACKLESLERCKINPEDACFNGLFEQKIIEDESIEALKEVYNKIMIVLKEYIDMPENNYKLIAIWIIGTWMHSKFETYPYLFLNAMRGTAKTRTLKLIAALENNGQILASLTEAVMFRENTPLGIDEFEGIGHKDKQALRELLNSAYKKGGKVKRMKKKKTIDGEEQVVQTFDPYRPIHMANIWGMEEVLGDRCISIFLEKSENKGITKLIEDYDTFPLIKEIKALFLEFSVVWCSVVSPENIYTSWHYYIKSIYTPNYTTTLTTRNYTQLHQELFKKIDEADIDGRNLELFLPLFLIADKVGILDDLILIAKGIVIERKIQEITESKDVLVFKLISTKDSNWIKINDLTATMRFMLQDEGTQDWLNNKWMGRALLRLQLIIQKRRLGEGVEVLLNIEKAKQKLEMFK